MVASIIHNNTCSAQMLWAPNNGYGYPWPFYSCRPTSTVILSVFFDMNTNHQSCNGSLTQKYYRVLPAALHASDFFQFRV